MTASHLFTLIYRLPPGVGESGTLVEALAEEGCDDALVGTGQAGRLALEFCREADTAEAALHSALADVRRAIPGARLIEAAPDYVGLTDAADRVGLSRQYLRKLMLAQQSTFPTPLHGGSTSIWHLADLLEWFTSQGIRPIAGNDIALARATRDVNLARAASRLPRGAARRLEKLVA